MWVVKILKDFEVEPSPRNCFRLPFTISIEADKMIGFLPVYETLEDAKSEYPNASYMEITKRENRWVGSQE